MRVDVLSASSEEAFELAELVDAMTFRRIDPERWHVQRDELSRRLRRMGGRLRAAGDRLAPTTTWRPSK